MWQPGETVVLQEVWRGKVWGARPMTVVEDAGDTLVLWFPRGTRWKAPTSDPSQPWVSDRGRRLARAAGTLEWVFRDAEWDVDTLQLTRKGDPYSVWVSWLPDGKPWGWYVNIQEPFRRTSLGIATMDWVLDVIIELDGTWRLKDEDELETFVRHKVIEPRHAAEIRAHALEVAHRAERSEPPFSEPWHEWGPDPAWKLPELPPRWNHPPDD